MSLKVCNSCPNRANCIYFKPNEFCLKEQLIDEDVFGYEKAQSLLLNKIFDAQHSEFNTNSKYSVKLRKEISEIMQFFKEQKEEEGDDEDAGLQEFETVATE